MLFVHSVEVDRKKIVRMYGDECWLLLSNLKVTKSLRMSSFFFFSIGDYGRRTEYVNSFSAVWRNRPHYHIAWRYHSIWTCLSIFSNVGSSSFYLVGIVVYTPVNRGTSDKQKCSVMKHCHPPHLGPMLYRCIVGQGWGTVVGSQAVEVAEVCRGKWCCILYNEERIALIQ